MTDASRYECRGFRAIAYDPYAVPDAKTAAEIFANRLAKREYGRSGYCRTIRLDSWAMDGSCGTYEVFIGHAVKGDPQTTTGHNERITIYIR